MKTTPRDFFLHLGILITLYISAISLANLLFRAIDVAFPNTEVYSYGRVITISWPVAALIVIFPLYLVLTWLLQRDYVAMPEKRGLGIHRWLIYVTLFVAAAAMLIDLVVLLYHFLEGLEITVGFLLKVLSVLVVAGLVFGYYIMDLRDRTSRSANRTFAIASIAIVIASIVAGFAIIGSPQTQRMARIDGNRVNDLQMIQSQILFHYQQKQTVPNTLVELSDDISGFVAPTDPETDAAYVYEKLSDTSFRLCADFALAADGENSQAPYPAEFYLGRNENWQHGEGRHCFERTIDPQLYPPTEKPLR